MGKKTGHTDALISSLGRVRRLSCFTTFSPMSLLLFSTRMGGQLKPNVHIGISRKTFSLLTQVRRAGSSSSFRVDDSGDDWPCSSNRGSVEEGLRNHGGLGSGSSPRIPQLASPCLQLPRSSESESRSVMSDSLQPQGLYRPWNSPGQNTGVGSSSILQGTFPTQGSNPGFFTS